MSDPADNTWRCPVCGLAPQVRGCKPGRCMEAASQAENARELMIARMKNGGKPLDFEAKVPHRPPQHRHPPPWEWDEVYFNADDPHEIPGIGLYDGNDELIVDLDPCCADDEDAEHSHFHLGDRPKLRDIHPYVRELTALAPTLEGLVRELFSDIGAPSECHCIGGHPQSHHCRNCRVREALARLDAAQESPTTITDLLTAFRATLPAVVVTVDEQTCPTCRLAAGSHGTATPRCERVANGTGICRCILVQPKAG